MGKRLTVRRHLLDHDRQRDAQQEGIADHLKVDQAGEHRAAAHLCNGVCAALRPRVPGAESAAVRGAALSGSAVLTRREPH